MTMWSSGESYIQDVTSLTRCCLFNGFNKDQTSSHPDQFRPGPPRFKECPALCGAFFSGLARLIAIFLGSNAVFNDRLTVNFRSASTALAQDWHSPRIRRSAKNQFVVTLQRPSPTQ